MAQIAAAHGGQAMFSARSRSAAKSGCPLVREPVARTDRNVL